MKTEEILKEAKTRMSDFKNDLEELSMKTTLGASEARDTIEKEWDKFTSFVADQGNKMRRQSAWANKLMDRIVDRLERLSALTLAEKPETDKRFNGWREEVIGLIYEVEFVIHEMYPILNDTERDMFSSLRVKMELYRTHLMLKTFNDFRDLSPMAEAMGAKISEVIGWYHGLHTDNKEKIEQFREEMRNSFNHLKGAFTALFK